MIGECPAYGKTCNSGHKKNHFEKYCFSKQNTSAMKIRTVGLPHDVYSDVETELFITLTINEQCNIQVGYRCSGEHYPETYFR